ncbi:hypothetical protein KCV87_00740 [Actinosynnema pretiosum subsp. pretiosum]|uniref:Uncharacterized protein n=1 Tax=Actinosynnema pretiosum subsp. pretiosum TaxID=103721 RepID=A0AA45L8G6_9PSEU|nr:hypothetical protein [Actinosynnema mirum]QUF04705.1 hypothetical protein KCV87_00740 [Actinosynnema pretiosum subsp. pretiosum]
MRDDKDPDGGHYCFQARGKSGHLALEIPETYPIKNDDHDVKSTVTVKGKTSELPVVQDSWTGIGQGVGPDHAVLIAIKAA